MNAIDTNVIAYLFDSTVPDKQVRAQQLLDGLVGNPSETVWLWQVAVEFLACLRKSAVKGKVVPEQVPVHFREIMQLFTLMCPPRAHGKKMHFTP